MKFKLFDSVIESHGRRVAMVVGVLHWSKRYLVRLPSGVDITRSEGELKKIRNNK